MVAGDCISVIWHGVLFLIAVSYSEKKTISKQCKLLFCRKLAQISQIAESKHSFWPKIWELAQNLGNTRSQHTMPPKHNTFDALRKHNKRHSVYECKSKLAKQRIDKMDPIKVVDIINASARTNELLAQLLEDNKVFKSQIDDLISDIKKAS